MLKNVCSITYLVLTFTGPSDSHKLVLAVLKTTFSKNKPKKFCYRDYKKIKFSDFNKNLNIMV